MRITLLATALAAFLVSTLALAQTPANITGTWRLNANNHQGDLIVTQASDGTLSGTMYGDPIRGYHASVSRWFIILRGPLNNPFQAFVGLVRRNGLEASGTFYALDASRGGGSTSRNVFNFFAARNRTSYPGDPGLPARSAGPADIGGIYGIDANDHRGRLRLFQRGSAISGLIYNNERLVGHYASGTGSVAFLRIRNGEPFQFFEGLARSSGGATQLSGSFYPITAAGGASPHRLTYSWSASQAPPPSAAGGLQLQSSLPAGVRLIETTHDSCGQTPLHLTHKPLGWPRHQLSRGQTLIIVSPNARQEYFWLCGVYEPGEFGEQYDRTICDSSEATVIRVTRNSSGSRFTTQCFAP